MIDVHSHLYPDSYLDLLRGRTEIPMAVQFPGGEGLINFTQGGDEEPVNFPITEGFWKIEHKIAFMDEHGIDQAVVGLGNPWLDSFNGPESPEIAARLNEEFAALERGTDGRVLGLGALPSDSVESAVACIASVAEAPTLYGIAGGPRICGRRLDHLDLEPVWDALSTFGLPYVLHPEGEFAQSDLVGYGMGLHVGIGFPVETTVALARLACGGVLHRHPGLCVVASHGGGVMPYLAGRLDNVWSTDENMRKHLPVPPSESLSTVYLDTLVYKARGVRAAADLVKPDHLMCGSDHPYYTSLGDPLDEIFEGEDLALVREGTARKLFGLDPRS